MEEKNHEEILKTQNSENTGGFTITEVFSDDDEDIERKELEKTVKKKLENKNRLIQKKIKNEIPLFKRYPRNKQGIVIAKPFDYNSLRKMEENHGVLFLQNTVNVLSERKQVKIFFSKFGKILRVEPKFNNRDPKRKLLEGYYIEFASKKKARIAYESCNNRPFSNRVPKPLTLKYFENFNWALISNENEKKRVLKLYLRAEAEKELRQIREYRSNLKESKKIKKNKGKMKNKFRYQYKQKEFRKKNTSTENDKKVRMSKSENKIHFLEKFRKRIGIISTNGVVKRNFPNENDIDERTNFEDYNKKKFENFSEIKKKKKKLNRLKHKREVLSKIPKEKEENLKNNINFKENTREYFIQRLTFEEFKKKRIKNEIPRDFSNENNSELITHGDNLPRKEGGKLKNYGEKKGKNSYQTKTKQQWNKEKKNPIKKKINNLENFLFKQKYEVECNKPKKTKKKKIPNEKNKKFSNKPKIQEEINKGMKFKRKNEQGYSTKQKTQNEEKKFRCMFEKKPKQKYNQNYFQKKTNKGMKYKPKLEQRYSKQNEPKKEKKTLPNKEKNKKKVLHKPKSLQDYYKQKKSFKYFYRGEKYSRKEKKKENVPTNYVLPKKPKNIENKIVKIRVRNRKCKSFVHPKMARKKHLDTGINRVKKKKLRNSNDNYENSKIKKLAQMGLFEDNMQEKESEEMDCKKNVESFEKRDNEWILSQFKL